METDTNQVLLNFFKALSEANRLKIVGLLAQHPHSVEELAGALGLGVSTTSHHLGKLSRAGLVTARAEGHYYIYSLQLDSLRSMAQTLLATENLPRLSPPADEGEAFERKVLATFTDSEGRITAFPAQEKKFLVLLKHVLAAFHPGRRYSEKEVNELLERYSEDTALLRRSLVDYGFMGRQGGGGEYWLVDNGED